MVEGRGVIQNNQNLLNLAPISSLIQQIETSSLLNKEVEELKGDLRAAENPLEVKEVKRKFSELIKKSQEDQENLNRRRTISWSF